MPARSGCTSGILHSNPHPALTGCRSDPLPPRHWLHLTLIPHSALSALSPAPALMVWAMAGRPVRMPVVGVPLALMFRETVLVDVPLMTKTQALLPDSLVVLRVDRILLVCQCYHSLSGYRALWSHECPAIAGRPSGDLALIASGFAPRRPVPSHLRCFCRLGRMPSPPPAPPR